MFDRTLYLEPLKSSVFHVTIKFNMHLSSEKSFNSMKQPLASTSKRLVSHRSNDIP